MEREGVFEKEDFQVEPSGHRQNVGGDFRGGKQLGESRREVFNSRNLGIGGVQGDQMLQLGEEIKRGENIRGNKIEGFDEWSREHDRAVSISVPVL